MCESVNIRTCINSYDMFNIIMCACVSVLCFVSILFLNVRFSLAVSL